MFEILSVYEPPFGHQLKRLTKRYTCANILLSLSQIALCIASLCRQNREEVLGHKIEKGTPADYLTIG